MNKKHLDNLVRAALSPARYEAMFRAAYDLYKEVRQEKDARKSFTFKSVPPRQGLVLRQVQVNPIHGRPHTRNVWVRPYEETSLDHMGGRDARGLPDKGKQAAIINAIEKRLGKALKQAPPAELFAIFEKLSTEAVDGPKLASPQATAQLSRGYKAAVMAVMHKEIKRRVLQETDKYDTEDEKADAEIKLFSEWAHNIAWRNYKKHEMIAENINENRKSKSYKSGKHSDFDIQAMGLEPELIFHKNAAKAAGEIGLMVAFQAMLSPLPFLLLGMGTSVAALVGIPLSVIAIESAYAKVQNIFNPMYVEKRVKQAVGIEPKDDGKKADFYEGRASNKEPGFITKMREKFSPPSIEYLIRMRDKGASMLIETLHDDAKRIEAKVVERFDEVYKDTKDMDLDTLAKRYIPLLKKDPAKMSSREYARRSALRERIYERVYKEYGEDYGSDIDKYLMRDWESIYAGDADSKFPSVRPSELLVFHSLANSINVSDNEPSDKDKADEDEFDAFLRGRKSGSRGEQLKQKRMQASRDRKDYGGLSEHEDRMKRLKSARKETENYTSKLKQATKDLEGLLSDSKGKKKDGS